jgi:tRNA nucleotidyltransferase (CCA-adding enzyme)
MALTSIQSFLRNWKLPVKLIKAVEKNINYLYILNKKSWTDLLLYEVGHETAVSVERIRSVITDPITVDDNVKRIENAILQLPIQSRDHLVITGHDIIQYMNQSPGPWVSKAIIEVEKAIVTNQLENNRSAIKEWLISCKQDFEQNY